MRRSSRRVPRVLSRKAGWASSAVLWIAGATFLGAAIVLLVRHPVAVGAVLLGFVVFGMWAKRRERLRLTALVASRSGESICGFARSFDARVVDPLVIRSVYEQLQDELHSYCLRFPVRASDRLTEDLGMDDDDLDMSIAPAVAIRSGRSFDGAEANPYYGRVKTASDLVHFFNFQREVDPVV